MVQEMLCVTEYDFNFIHKHHNRMHKSTIFLSKLPVDSIFLHLLKQQNANIKIPTCAHERVYYI